ncbi:MAG: MarR family transcriptional regulator [Clostridia bacterium]|nr:MarR family transcriptional regulator [Clostridia bacterium]
MACKKKNENDKYLKAVFALLRRNERMSLAGKKTHFNNTEIRLICEILAAKEEGERLISTQLAKLLGITRSAISQIVNHLEAEGVVKRVADDVDRKIAYIEVTEETLVNYQKDIDCCKEFIGNVVEKFGKDNFETMCVLFDSFMDTVEAERKASNAYTSCKKGK